MAQGRASFLPSTAFEKKRLHKAEITKAEIKSLNMRKPRPGEIRTGRRRRKKKSATAVVGGAFGRRAELSDGG